MSRPIIKLTLGIIVLLLFLACFLFFIARSWPESYWKPLQLQLESRYGIKIRMENITFPAWFRAKNAHYRETFRFERASVLKRLAVDLSRYPEMFLKRNLSGIVILRSLEMNGLLYGGTYDIATNTLFIDSGWLGDDGSTDEAMGLHHEFSSLLIYRYPEIFKVSDWAKLNPKDFLYQYSVSSSANLATGKLDLVGNPEIWNQGFLSAYGQLTLEDDINTYAQYLVAKKDRWPELANRYPMLDEKMQLLVRWYCEIGFSTSKDNCEDSYSHSLD